MLMNRLFAVALILVSLVSLHGCAGAVVGGAAAGAAVANDRRSAGAMLDDQVIELKVLDRMLKHKDIMEQTHVNATSYNHVLLLTGEAPTEELLRKLEEILRDIPKITRMHNEVAIATPTSMTSRGNDAWITAKVKSKLFSINTIEGFDPTRAKVVTENSTVYLMGLVTKEEADAVTEVARKVDGVKRVVKIFEYVDTP